MLPPEFFHDHPVIDIREDGIYMFWTQLPTVPPGGDIIKWTDKELENYNKWKEENES